MEIELSSKERAKALYDAGCRSAISLSRGAGVCLRTAYNYLAEFKEGDFCKRKNYTPREKPKRTSKLEQKVIRKAKERNHIWSTRAIGASFDISHTLAQQILKENKIKYQRYQRQLKLTKENKAQILKFAQEMKKKWSDWGFIIFTDECSFWREDTRPKKIWTDDPENEEGTGVHGIKIHCWGAISARGAFPIQIFEDNFKANQLVSLMQKTLPYIAQLYPEGFIWQQDSSGVHRAKIVEDFIEENMPLSLSWPAYSPDISPLENIWSWLKGEVAKDCPKNLQSLKACIRKHWNRINESFLSNFINSMPERMKALVNNKGGKIRF